MKSNRSQDRWLKRAGQMAATALPASKSSGQGRSRIRVALISTGILIVGLSTGLAVMLAHTRDLRLQESREEFNRRLEAAVQTLDVNQIPIDLKARNFTVVGRERKTGSKSIHLTLRNNYPASITAFEVSWGRPDFLDRLDEDELTAVADQSILPGSTKEVLLDLNDPDLTKNGIQIQAVLFNDGTGDGDPAAIKYLVQIRAGELLQTEHTLGMLRTASAAPDAAVEISAIETDLQGPPPGSMLAPGSGLSSGASLARSCLSRYVRDISANIAAGKNPSGLSELITFLTERSTQFKASLSPGNGK